MRKTFLKVSLVTLIAMSMSATFTGCKDYDDDINNLTERVDKIDAAIKAINDKVAEGFVITKVEPLTDGTGGIRIYFSNNTYQDIHNGAKGEQGLKGEPAVTWEIVKNDKGEWVWKNSKDGITDIPAQGPAGPAGTGSQGDQGQTGAPGPYWAPNEDGTELIKFIYDANAKDYVKDPNATPIKIAITVEGNGIVAVKDNDYLYLHNVQTGVDAAGKPIYDTVKISINGMLRGMIFVPDLYLDGVEGTRYAFATGTYKKPSETATSGNITITPTVITDGTETTPAVTAKYTIPATTAWSYVNQTGANKDYQLGSNDSILFELNPHNANIKSAKFFFADIANKEQVSTSRAANTDPAFAVSKTIAPKVNDKDQLVLSYTVANPEKVVYTAAGKNTLPITALKAEVEDDTISSDFFTVVMSKAEFTAFSFIPTAPATNDVHLALTGKEAIEGEHEIQLSYAQKADALYDLSQHIRVCYKEADFGKNLDATGDDAVAEKQASLAELATRWGLTVKFAGMPYYVGDSKTDESKYADVSEAGVVTLRYITNGAWTNCSDDAASRSAIGKHPVVAVTLLDGDKVILAGYVKITIVDKTAVTPPIANTPIVLASKEFPYLCDAVAPAKNGSVVSTWETTSDKVLSVLGISEAEFKATYTVEEGTTYVEGTTANTFVKVADNKYGDVVYNADSEAGPTNGFLTWTYSKDNADEIAALNGRKVELFRKFENKNNKQAFLYLGVEVTISAAPSITFGTIDPLFLATGKTNEVGMRVPQAKNTFGKDVYAFNALLKDYYKDDVIAETYTGTAPAGYPTIANLGVNKTYRFADTQFTGLTLNGDKTQLMSGTDLIASIDKTTGNITYGSGTTTTEKAKELLNGGTGAYNIWANVKIDATYGTCGLNFTALAGDVVKVDFKKPVIVGGAKNYSIAPNGIDPSKESIGNFFTLTDSYGNALFGKAEGATAWSDVKGIYDFYKVESASIDFSKVAVSGVTFSMEGPGGTVTAPVAGTETTPANPAYVANLSKVANLNDIKVVCDYGNEVLEKQQVVEIPVTVKYSWGTQTVKATVTILPFPAAGN